MTDIVDWINIIAACASAGAAWFAYRAAKNSVKAQLFRDRLRVFQSFIDFYQYWVSKGRPATYDATNNIEAKNILDSFKKAKLISEMIFSANAVMMFKELDEMAARYSVNISKIEYNHRDREDALSDNRNIERKIANSQEFENAKSIFQREIGIKP